MGASTSREQPQDEKSLKKAVKRLKVRGKTLRGGLGSVVSSSCGCAGGPSADLPVNSRGEHNARDHSSDHPAKDGAKKKINVKRLLTSA
eukprot:scaffold148372_cov41-Prasinocladus_malaysianus.AAC.1